MGAVAGQEIYGVDRGRVVHGTVIATCMGLYVRWAHIQYQGDQVSQGLSDAFATAAEAETRAAEERAARTEDSRVRRASAPQREAARRERARARFQRCPQPAGFLF